MPKFAFRLIKPEAALSAREMTSSLSDEDCNCLIRSIMYIGGFGLSLLIRVGSSSESSGSFIGF